MRHLLFSVGLALAALGATAAPARAVATGWVGDTGIEIRLAPGWHTYWRTPGDAGLAPSVDWSGSGNVTAAAMSWPAPTRLVVEGLQNNVYEGSVMLPVSVGVAQPSEPVRLRATISYAACAEVCVPYHADLALTVPAGAVAAADPEIATLAAARGRVPGNLATASAELISATLDKTASAPALTVRLRSEGQPFIMPDLFVEGAGSGSPAAPKVELRQGGHLATLLVPLPHGAFVAAGKPAELTLVDGNRMAEFTVMPEPDGVSFGWDCSRRPAASSRASC